MTLIYIIRVIRSNILYINVVRKHEIELICKNHSLIICKEDKEFIDEILQDYNLIE